MATVPTLQARNLGAHHNKAAHGNGVMEAGMNRAGVAGMHAMIPLGNMIIIINPGTLLMILSHHNHMPHSDSLLPPYLFPSHQHQQLRKQEYGGPPPVALGLKDKALRSISPILTCPVTASRWKW